MDSAASNVGGSGARSNESGPELDAATMPPTSRKVCHRYHVESAAGLLGMGKLWPRSVREETLKSVRRLPTYDRATDTVVVCRYVDV